MLKAKMIVGTREVLLLGLTFGNLDRLRAGPGDDHIVIEGDDIGIEFDIWIVAGETEAALEKLIAPGIGPDTKVNISSRIKN